MTNVVELEGPIHGLEALALDGAREDDGGEQQR